MKTRHYDIFKFGRREKVDLREWRFPELDDLMAKRDRGKAIKQIGAVIEREVKEDTSLMFELSKGRLVLVVGLPLNGAYGMFGQVELAPEMLDDLMEDHFPDVADLRKIAKALRSLADRADATVADAEEHLQRSESTTAEGVAR